MDIVLYPLRIILLTLVTIYYSLAVIVHYTLSGGNKRYHRLIRNWAALILFISGTKLKISGIENINADDTYVFASNHSSLFDIPIMVKALGVDLRIIYKKELEKIPIFGWGLRKSPYIAINRDDPREAMSSLEEAINSIKTGDSVIIYPEGTRSPSGKMGTFKRGAFTLAAKAGKPIIPITIIGSWTIIPSGKKIIRSREIEFIIHPSILPQVNNSREERELMEKVYEIISSSLPQE